MSKDTIDGLPDDGFTIWRADRVLMERDLLLKAAEEIFASMGASNNQAIAWLSSDRGKAAFKQLSDAISEARKGPKYVFNARQESQS